MSDEQFRELMGAINELSERLKGIHACLKK